jgi:hypothetical protein
MGMTREGLAEKCTSLGLVQFGAAAVTNIESGRRRPKKDPNTGVETLERRREITVDELAVIARALNVPPVSLIYPVGHSAKTEITKGEEVDTWLAAQWFCGEARLDGSDISTDPQAAPVVLYRRHQQLVNSWALGMWIRQAPTFTEESKVLASNDAAMIVDQIRRLHEEIRRLGLVTPSLPADLSAHVYPSQDDPFDVPADSPTAGYMRSIGRGDYPFSPPEGKEE